MDRQQLLQRFAASKEDRMLLAEVLDKQAAANRGRRLSHTAFLDGRQQALAKDMLAASGARNAVFFGGSPESERRVLLFLPDWMAEEDVAESVENPVAFFRAAFDGERHALSHRDFLGALMGMGVARESVGDIGVFEGFADVAVLKTVLPTLLEQMESAGRAKLRLTQITAADVVRAAPEYREIRATVQSARLDRIAAAGFGISRTAAAALVQAGSVVVNHQISQKPDRPLAEGDAVSAKGYGKFMLKSIGGATKKGRLPVEIWKYV